jgi:hypothetical protein
LFKRAIPSSNRPTGPASGRASIVALQDLKPEAEADLVVLGLKPGALSATPATVTRRTTIEWSITFENTATCREPPNHHPARVAGLRVKRTRLTTTTHRRRRTGETNRE